MLVKPAAGSLVDLYWRRSVLALETSIISGSRAQAGCQVFSSTYAAGIYRISVNVSTTIARLTLTIIPENGTIFLFTDNISSHANW